MDHGKGDGTAETSAQRASDDLRAAFARLRRRLREVSTAAELSPAQVSVLARIDKGEASTASSLASVEGVRPQSMAAILASLGQLGFIDRSADPSDGRQQIVTLTDVGRNRNSDLRQARGEWLTQVLQDKCTAEERRTVIDAMAIIERLVAE
jgi:DNA-binding MarR family transcriptional regulator